VQLMQRSASPECVLCDDDKIDHPLAAFKRCEITVMPVGPTPVEPASCCTCDDCKKFLAGFQAGVLAADMQEVVLECSPCEGLSFPQDLEKECGLTLEGPMERPCCTCDDHKNLRECPRCEGKDHIADCPL
jgi:hypothetical protein